MENANDQQELISRQKVLEYLNGLIVNVGRCNGKGIFTRMLSDYVEYVKGLPTEKKASEWIPISLDGKLPEEEEICLVCGKNGGMCVARFYRRKNTLLWTKTGTGKYVSPIAWMPLPECYRSENVEQPDKKEE